MTFFHRAALARAGAAAVLAVGGLTAVSSPAHAADLPDLVLMPISTSLAKGVEAAQAKPFKFTVRNVGTATAKDVSVRVKTDRLKPKRVGYVVPDGCQVVADQIYDCRLGDLPAGTSEDFGIPLFSTGGKGDGGVLTVGVATTSPSRTPPTNSSTCRSRSPAPATTSPPGRRTSRTTWWSTAPGRTSPT